MANPETHPEFLYKYITWPDNKSEDQWRRRILTHNEMYFSSPLQFNDPFDCGVGFKWEGLSLEDYRNFVYEFVDSEITSDTDRMKMLLKMKETAKKFANKDVLAKTVKKTIDIVNRKMGVFSLSGNLDSILLWSHYTSAHRGICLCYKFGELKEFIKGLIRIYKSIILFRRIIYSQQYPNVIPKNMNDEERFVAPLLIKSLEWKYEDEYRVIGYNMARKTYRYENYILGRVILGARINQEHKKEIIDIIKNKHSKINIFQAKLKDNEFGLDFEEIKY